jgi:protein-disulfide isomerase
MLRPLVSDNDQFTGNLSSVNRLVEYGDYQCPHCGHAHPLVKRLLSERGNDFLFVFRNFPLQQIHPAAFMAAAAAEAAGSQGQFWTMHDFIFENQKKLLVRKLPEYAETLGLDMDQFLQQLESDSIKEKIEADFESGVRSGVNGTPTFYINGERLDYDTTYESLLKAIDRYDI